MVSTGILTCIQYTLHTGKKKELVFRQLYVNKVGVGIQ